MSKFNTSSLSRRSLSVAQQKPQPYYWLDDKWPEYIQIQRVPGVINGTNVSFTTQTFDPNYFLKSRAFLKITIGIERFELDLNTGALTPANLDITDLFRKKRGMVLANAMKTAKLRLNSTSINYDEQRYWNQVFLPQHCGRAIVDNYLSTSGSSFPWHTGIFDELGNVIIDRPSDPGIQEQIDAGFKDISPSLTSKKSFRILEPLNMGPFNFMHDKVGEIWPKSFYNKMSPLIPYVNQLGLDLEFKDMSANTLFFNYGLNTDVGNDISIVFRDENIQSAELILTWVKPRPAMIRDLPPKVKLQSFYVDHKIFPLITTIDGTGIIPWATATQVDIKDIHIHQVPTYMMMWATVDKDGPSYDCRSLFSDSDGGGTGGTDPSFSKDINSMETKMLPLGGITVRVNILGGDDVIDGSYNNNELYRFTTKNSIKDFPWGQTQWRGNFIGRYAAMPCEFFLILGEDDMNSFFVRKGQKVRDFVVDIRSEMVNDDAYSIDDSIPGFDTGGDKQFNFHVAFVYDRFYVELDDCGNVTFEHDAGFL